MAVRSTVEILGYLDNVREEKIVRIEGWAAAADAEMVEGFQVTMNGIACEVLGKTLRIPSPDVQATFPYLSEAGYCRFLLHARIPDDLPCPLRDTLVSVEPVLSSGARGRELWYMVGSTLPEPPKEYISVIGGVYADVALEFLYYFIHKGDLRPTDRVLDVGCGMGRMAYGLVYYLKPEARYEGFDIIPELIDWATREISSRHPQFHFTLAPIYNSFYNPGGTVSSSDFQFPYESESFDFVFLTSVFTHMIGRDVQHYLDEIHRVLRPGGRCLMTCFLLNPVSEKLIAEGKSTLNLLHPMGEGKVLDRRNPDAAIGFEETLFKGWIEQSGLKIIETSYGLWSGRSDFTSYQDIIIVGRE